MLRRKDLIGWLFASPVVVGLLAFTVCPFVASLYLSFCDYDIFTSPRWVWCEDAARRHVLSPRQALEHVASDVDRELENFMLSRSPRR
jgi:ABC-type sugar transport system permease subunit